MSTESMNPNWCPPLAHVDGWAINIRNLDDAVAQIISAAHRAEGFSVNTLNLDHLVQLRGDEHFRDAYRSARFVTADGAPVARLARRENCSIERTTGANLFVSLSLEAAREGLPVFLFGSRHETLTDAASRLVERSDGAIAIAGTWAPSSSFDPEGPEADEAIDRIARSGARICFVALGAPKQEIFSARAVRRGLKVGFICVGAAIDFFARKQIPAPMFMQRNGLEWAWRLVTNPRRLAPRYARCALMLTEIEILAPLRQCRGSLLTLAGRR